MSNDNNTTTKNTGTNSGTLITKAVGCDVIRESFSQKITSDKGTKSKN